MSTNIYVDMCMHVQACTHVPVYAGQVQVCCATSVRCAEHLHSFLRFGVGKDACLGAVTTRSIDLATRSQSWHRATRNLSLNATAQASKDRGGSHLAESPQTDYQGSRSLSASPFFFRRFSPETSEEADAAAALPLVLRSSSSLR